MRFYILLLIAALAISSVCTEEVDDGTHTHEFEMNTDEGTAQFTTPDNEVPVPLYDTHPDICKKVINTWQPVVLAKAEAMQELSLFNTAGVLASDLDIKLQEHKKTDHNHFNCHEAKELLSTTAAREIMSIYKTVLEAPMKGYTGDQVVAVLKEMRDEMEAKHIIVGDSVTEFNEAIADLEKMKEQYKQLKIDYDAVHSEHAECTTNYQRYIKEMLELSHDDIPQWEHLQWGLDSLKEQCTRSVEL